MIEPWVYPMKNQIQIGAYTVKLETTDQLLHKPCGGRAFGIYDPVKQSIKIARMGRPERILVNLLHEINEAAMDIYHNVLDLKHDQKERICDLIAMTYSQILSDRLGKEAALDIMGVKVEEWQLQAEPKPTTPGPVMINEKNQNVVLHRMNQIIHRPDASLFGGLPYGAFSPGQKGVFFTNRRMMVGQWGKTSQRDDHEVYITNARIENWEKPYWADDYRYRRCVVPADAWVMLNIEDRKTPVLYMSQKPFYFAGIWRWGDEDRTDEEMKTSFAILTGPAGTGIGSTHHRSPLIVPDHHLKAWLDRQTDERLKTLHECLIPEPPDLRLITEFENLTF